MKVRKKTDTFKIASQLQNKPQNQLTYHYA